MELKGKTAYHITTEGETIEVTPKNKRYFRLKEVQSLVDGYIEVISINSEWIMIVNEEGKYTKPYNEKATQIAHFYQAILWHDYICGDVVICRSKLLP